MEPVVGMEDPFRYRNKAQFPCGYDKDGNIVFGFYAARSHQVIPIDDCLLGVSENAKDPGCHQRVHGSLPYQAFMTRRQGKVCCVMS